ncbi:hypothetical protein [Geminocystis sp. NIES-3709]|uniref:hypothetical protein n=1 Tax=Geminocystis sp. NIES-3709 TaxID=1617448 RepID=UPI0005FC9DDB|nr:hypothetical protein [Geminocystis sp. NIES-3709]BAQ66675.1 hypothetical protein GM3709_3440 [Geminocystis sp. NIES-3709]
MNKKINEINQNFNNLLTLIYRANLKEEKGFTFLAVLGFSLVAITAGVVMVAKANSNKLTATNTQQAVQAEKAVQAGATQIQDFLRKNPVLLTLPSTNWNNTAIAAKITELQGNNQLTSSPSFQANTSGSSSSACNNLPTTATPTANTVVSNLSTGIGVTAGNSGTPTTTWASLPNLPSGESLSYRLLTYDNGTMQIGGRVGGTNGSGAEYYTNVTFPVVSNTRSVADSIPSVNGEGIGLWVKSPSSSSDIRTNILVTCPSSGNIFSSSPFDVSGYKIIGTNMTMPATPATPTANFRAITSTSGVTVPSATDISATGSAAPYITNADGTREYRYTISSITGDFTVNVPDRVGVPSGKYDKVTVYVSGDIDLQGGQSAIKNSRIQISGGNLVYPANTGELQLRIIGKSANGDIHLGGNASICSAFIHAPTYDLDINGGGQAQGCYAGTGGLNMSTGGTQNPNNRGVYWINSWDGGGQGNHVAHLGTGATNAELATYLNNVVSPALGSPDGWERIEKPN